MGAAVAALALVACPGTEGDGDTVSGDLVSGDTTSGGPGSGGSASGSGGSASGGECGALPSCDYCPGSFSTMCGLACETEGRTCSNEIGDGLSCSGGTWQCVVHPPLSPGCNELCQGAEACTEIGCTDGIEIRLVADAGGFPPGDYTLTITLDGEADACSFTVSDDPGQCASPPCALDSTCNATYDLGGEIPNVTILASVAATLSVTVELDGQAIADESPDLLYSLSAPNGAGCRPVCSAAAVEIAISPTTSFSAPRFAQFGGEILR